MRYLHPLAGCPSLAARRQPLADASAAVSPSPLFLVASTPQPYGTPAHQDRAPPPPPPPRLFVSLPACPLLRACMLTSLPPPPALLGGVWMGTPGWFGVSCHGGGGYQVDQETRTWRWGSPIGSLTLWPWPPRFCGHAPRVFSAPECSHNSWVVLRSTLSNFPLVVVIHDPP